MCGIAGYISSQGHRNLQASLEAIQHRGPDASGVWIPENLPCAVGLGHVRLSILDTGTRANQPFCFGDSLALVFNGEIYNHASLREELQAKGYTFTTHSDTEVVLHAWREFGRECFSRFDGMFALALTDNEKGITVLARDRLGIKPLYWREDASGWQFCSEIKGLGALSSTRLQPDSAFFAEFLLNGFLYEPHSGFIGVEKVPPGHGLTIDWKHWKATPFTWAQPLNAPEGESLEELVDAAARLQSEADVPVGLFFSGGVDSSVLAASLGGRLKGFCATYPGREAEAATAKDIAERLHLPLEMAEMCAESRSPEDILEAFRAVAAGTGEPISDFTFLATAELSALARARGFKVMLSGMGADELFAGYPRYLMLRLRPLLRALSPLLRASAGWLRKHPSLARKTDRLIRFAAEADFVKAYTQLIGYLGPEEVNALLQNPHACESFWARMRQYLRALTAKTDLEKALALDLTGFLAHNLTVTDMASMQHAVEIRVPLLADSLLAYAQSAKVSTLMGFRRGKQPLRALLAKKLPHLLVNQPKAGFNPPLDASINALGEARIAAILQKGPVSRVCCLSVMQSILSAHFSGKRNETCKIWQLLYFNFWLEHHGAFDERVNPQKSDMVESAA